MAGDVLKESIVWALRQWQGTMTEEELADAIVAIPQLADLRSQAARIAEVEAERDAARAALATAKPDLLRKVADYYEAEIARLMHQAEVWAQPEYERPYAVHHRIHKAMDYFQVVHLMRRPDAVETIETKAYEGPAGDYSRSSAMHARYFHVRDVAVLPPMPGQRPWCAPIADLDAARAQAAALAAGSPADIRAAGWAVAVHNDYRLNGQPHTFWLFTRGDRAVKGEGETDAEALAQVRTALAAYDAQEAAGG